MTRDPMVFGAADMLMPIRPGMRILDHGCALSMDLREGGHEPQAGSAIVLRLYPPGYSGFWIWKNGAITSCGSYFEVPGEGIIRRS